MRKIQISVFASVVIFTTSLYADSMKRYAENITITHVSPTGGDGYYSGGCRYTFETRSVRFFTLQTAGFPEMLGRLIKQCGGGRMQA